MIKRKKKICKNCKKERYIFGKGLCTYCYRSQQKPVNKVSKTYKETLKLYRPKRKAFLKDRPFCEVRLEGCTGRSEVIHHRMGKDSREVYLDEKLWMASCSNCNLKIETLGEEAFEKGFRIRKK